LKNNKAQTMEPSSDKTSQPEIHYIIVHEEMIWQYYFDESGSKYFRELLGMEARKFVRSLSTEVIKDQS
jgi:hypothetical protein